MVKSHRVKSKRFRIQRGNGFTLVEILIAVFILSVASYMAITLYILTGKNALTVEKNIDEQDAIKADLSTIHRISRQFVCLTDGSKASCGCFVTTGVGDCTQENLSAYPTEMDFISSDYYDNPTTRSLISTLCTNGIGGLVSAEIISLGNPATLTTLGVTRTASADSDNKDLFHVAWTSSDGLTLQKASFHPTLSTFCP